MFSELISQQFLAGVWACFNSGKENGPKCPKHPVHKVGSDWLPEREHPKEFTARRPGGLLDPSLKKESSLYFPKGKKTTQT